MFPGKRQVNLGINIFLNLYGILITNTLFIKVFINAKFHAA